MSVLLVGGTGRLGARVARELRSSGVAVRALCRPGAPVGMLRRLGAELVTADLREGEAVAAACQGITTVVCTATAALRDAPDAIAAVDGLAIPALWRTAHAQGAVRGVYVSMLPARADHPVPLLLAKGAAEAALERSGLDWSVIAPDLVLDAWVAPLLLQPWLAGATARVPTPVDAPHAFIAEHDVAQLCVAAVRAGRGEGRLVVGGPQAISWRDVSALAAGLDPRLREAHVDDHDGATPSAAMPAAMWDAARAWDAAASCDDSAAVMRAHGVTATPIDAWVRASLGMRRDA